MSDSIKDVNGHPIVAIGDILRCAETGKLFKAASDGFTTNYAWSNTGEVLSDEGVMVRQRRELLDHSKPFYAYVSSDGKFVQGWKAENKLGDIIQASQYALTRQSWMHGRYIHSYVVRDVHGALWYGRGNPGICITLRAYGSRARKAA